MKKEKTETNDNGRVKNEATDNTKAKDTLGNYYSYLCKNYPAMKSGNVSISGKYLEQCSHDPKKAQELEEFIKSIPEREKQGYERLAAQNRALGGTVTYYQQTWMINEDGSIQSSVYSVTDTGTSNAEKLKKSIEERLEKQKEKKAEDKKKEEIKAEKKSEEKLKADKATEKTVQTEYIEADSPSKIEKMIKDKTLPDAYKHSIDLCI